MDSWFASPEAPAIEEAPWQRALTVCVATTTLALLLDFCLVKRVVPHGARYFVCHVCFNTWLTCVVFADSLVALRNPSQALLGDGDLNDAFAEFENEHDKNPFNLSATTSRRR